VLQHACRELSGDRARALSQVDSARGFRDSTMFAKARD
jgi:hypothetical protein